MKQIGPGMYIVGDELHLEIPEIARHLGIPDDAITERMLEDVIARVFEDLGADPPPVEHRDDAGSWRQ